MSNDNEQHFFYLSKLINLPIVDICGRKAFGKVSDFVVDAMMEPYPVVNGIVFVEKNNKRHLISWQKTISINGELLIGNISNDDIQEIQLKEGEILLKETILDKQIVDTDGAKVRRVNDLQFLRISNNFYLINVDVGFRGLMRRVGLEKLILSSLHAIFDYTLPDQFISWKFVQPLSSPDFMRLKVTQEKLSRIHPADLADIIEDLDIHQRNAVFQTLDVETAAETLEETDPKIQVSLIEDMQTEKASDIIEEMSLSDATDLIQ
ncbi:MAG: hypothetical protein WCJ49_07015, partial [Deltaproteobacteria bacterium]